LRKKIRANEYAGKLDYLLLVHYHQTWQEGIVTLYYLQRCTVDTFVENIPCFGYIYYTKYVWDEIGWRFKKYFILWL